MIEFINILFDEEERVEMEEADLDCVCFSDGYYWIENTDGLTYKTKAINYT